MLFLNSNSLIFLPKIFRDILRQLLQGKALSIEDIIELLTLKDNTDSVENYATSVHLLQSVTVRFTLTIRKVSLSHALPESARSAQSFRLQNCVAARVSSRRVSNLIFECLTNF